MIHQYVRGWVFLLVMKSGVRSLGPKLLKKMGLDNTVISTQPPLNKTTIKTNIQLLMSATSLVPGLTKVISKHEQSGTMGFKSHAYPHPMLQDLVCIVYEFCTILISVFLVTECKMLF